MGLDYSALLLCQMVFRECGDFGRVLTIGRQRLCVTRRHLSRLGIPAMRTLPLYCETLLMDAFGASSVESLDASGYEQPTFIADLNLRHNASEAWKGAFDTVLNFGTLEHVFDVRTAFDEVSSSLRIGGTAVHLLPANQECGHGFYQFSPEFFFSYFQRSRGYSDTRVFAVDPESPHTWWQLTAPEDGARLNIRSGRPLYIACFATRLQEVQPTAVQQSDYLHVWARADGGSKGTSVEVENLQLDRGYSPALDRLLMPLMPLYRWLRRFWTVLQLASRPIICDGVTHKVRPLKYERSDSKSLSETLR